MAGMGRQWLGSLRPATRHLTAGSTGRGGRAHCGDRARHENRRMLPDAPAGDLLEAFLAAHAQGAAVPAALFSRGLELHQRLAAAPPALPAWGRFLVAMGQLAADDLDDATAASRFFLAALQGAERHGDHEAAVTAGYDQGVLNERRGNALHARAAYRAAAGEGFRLGVLAASTLRAATAAVRLHFAEHDQLGESAPLAKQAWLGWLWLRLNQPERLDAELVDELGRQLCALLLPEDDPGQLAAAWRAWPPATLATPSGPWHDHADACLDELFAAAAEAADTHLRDEGDAPGAPYRLLAQAARRQRRP